MSDKKDRRLSIGQYQAIIKADKPSSVNPFATIADAGTYLPLAGGTMTGDIDMDSNKLLNGTGALTIVPTAILFSDGTDTIGLNATQAKVVYNKASIGKSGNLELDSITDDRTWTMPDASGTVALEGIKGFQALTDQATITWDYALGYNAEVTLAGNRTLAEPTNAASGDYGTLVITQDGTGSRTLTLPASFKVVNGGTGAITLSTAAASVDSISWVKKGSIFLVSLGLNFN
jgi:hypothetical protein